MQTSYIAYTGDGNTKTFAVPFPYLHKKHVYVLVNNEPVLFSWLTDASVTLTSPPANKSIVVVQRTTPRITSLVSYSDGSTLRGEDLTTQADQLLYIVQEAYDALSASMQQGATELAIKAAVKAESAADKAVYAAGQITNLSVAAKTHNPGTAASASYDVPKGLLTLGIPRGDKGDKGVKGDTGAPGMPALPYYGDVLDCGGAISAQLTTIDAGRAVWPV